MVNTYTCPRDGSKRPVFTSPKGRQFILMGYCDTSKSYTIMFVDYETQITRIPLSQWPSMVVDQQFNIWREQNKDLFK